MSTPSRRRYPLQKLLQLRAHRTEKARLLVADRQRVVRDCREACVGENPALQSEGRACGVGGGVPFDGAGKRHQARCGSSG